MIGKYLEGFIMPIQSVERAIQILNLFSYSHPNWGITEMSSAVQLAKATVYNIVNTLERGGFLQRLDGNRKYSLGPSIYALGTIMANTLEINQKALYPAQNLSESTGLVCRVAIWNLDSALAILEVDPRDPKMFAPRIGPRLLAYCTALGRALLANMKDEEIQAYLSRTELRPLTPYTITDPKILREELELTKGRGYAINNQEIAVGRASIATPVFGGGGRRLEASISLSGSPDMVLGEKADSLYSVLGNTAIEISSSMGFYPGSLDQQKRT
jgi:IclR family transcriptional regulator, KDG regulon repressor